MNKTKAVDISHQCIGDITFPSITICPITPKPIKALELKKCRLSFINYDKGFIGVNNDTNLPIFCQNPKDLHIKIMRKITEMKISQIK